MKKHRARQRKLRKKELGLKSSNNNPGCRYYMDLGGNLRPFRG